MSSYSGSTLNSSESDVEDITHSDIESEYIPSETSEDREFIVSDSESLSFVPNELSEPEGPSYTILDDIVSDVTTEQSVKSLPALQTLRALVIMGIQRSDQTAPAASYHTENPLVQEFGQLQVLDDLIRLRAADIVQHPILAYPRSANHAASYDYYSGQILNGMINQMFG
ncbi:hypothetical protein PEX2_065490 [Penicillium expansum]|uniref:Uncharacterized protein n=1 Tax=Penicillium expansum TaxID=27334 RepID=A0A0A2JZV2_PENEN|nr:hypothetical protein PEX2_065490 [Penicillium expansum]KGO61007.1 hypothetical protein PEX2_065490 [Penicillium expansum]